MKNRLSAISSLILAVILSLASLNCCMAAETETGDELSDELQSLKKTEEERQSEFNKALTGIPYEVTDFDKNSFQDGLKRSKNNFMRLYRSQWKSMGMDERLENAVNTAFDDNTKDLMWGTAGLQIGINKGNIVDKIQEDLAFKFSGAFDDFLLDLENKWAGTLQKDVSDFYQRTSVLLLASENNPMSRAFIRSSLAAQDKGQDVIEGVKASLQQKYPDLGISGTKLAGGFAAIILRQQIKKILVKQLSKTAFRKLAGTGLTKIAGMAVPAVGWALVAWSAWDVVSMAWNAPDEVRNMLQERNQALYSREIPEIYWDAMEPYVMDTFVFSYENLQKTKEEALRLAKDPRVAGLAIGLNDDAAAEFAQKISALYGALGEAGNENLLQDFGELIRDSSAREFNLLVSMLRQKNKTQVKEWFKVAGTRYFDIYDSFSADVWENFPPSRESFDALVWITKLPPKARRAAVKLQTADLKWIMEELPERFVSRLFGGDEKQPEAIHDEIERLSAISDREAREPWQSSMGYWWTQYGFYVKVVVVILILIPILRLLLILKNRAGKTKGSEAQTPVVNINIPSYPPSYADASGYAWGKKYKVKLKVSADLARELSTITWDLSQKLLPADDGSGSRILDVGLDSLSDIARWAARNKTGIEVLQPDELKAEIEKLMKGA